MSEIVPECDHADPEKATPAEPAPAALERAARLFRALGDEGRLRLLHLLDSREWCVGELASALKEKLPTMSQRLKLLRLEGLVRRRRDGNHAFYSLADRHVADLLHNALDHADELSAQPARPIKKGIVMSETHLHGEHSHEHGPSCGHKAVKHGDHVDYLHDGHLHHPTAHGVEEHVLAVDGKNPSNCTPTHDCGAHAKDHVHGPGCGHEAVPHGDHVDYLVDGHLHHPHGDHCDDHGPVEVA